MFNEILVITTHYPYGIMEENWVAHELEEFPKHFDRVHVLPVKELEGCRALPRGVDLWPPLVKCNRLSFFARQTLNIQTWRYYFNALTECFKLSEITIPRMILCYKYSCYRAAFERNVRLRRFLNKNVPKIVYAYWGHIPALAIPLSKRLGAGTCVRYHRYDLVADGPEQGFNPWRTELREATELNAFVASAGLKFYSSKYENNISACHNLVSRLGTQDFGTQQFSRNKTHENSTITMASASWITPIKRVELIAKLSEELLRSGKKVVWHHFGGSRMREVDSSIEAARKAGVTVTIHGLVPVEQIQVFYRKVKITFFVNLSRHEGVPVSIMEAMNADIPVVATAVGGTPEVVIEGRSGLLVDPNIENGLASLARRITNELEPGGLLASARPRVVWEEMCDGRKNARALATQIKVYAK